MSETSNTTAVVSPTTGTIVYHDYSQVLESNEQQQHHGGGAAVVATTTSGHSNSTTASPRSEQNFPTKLHYILDEMDKDGMSHIASWQSHGRCFMVHQQDAFVEQVLRRWFSQSKFASFRRQLNIYGFHRITAGPDKGGYYHELFLRGKRFLTLRIPRVYIKGVGIGGQRRPNSTDTVNVNFYSMRPLLSAVVPPATNRGRPHQGSIQDGISSSRFNEEPVVTVREGSLWHRRPQQYNVAAAALTTQFRDNNNRLGFPTHYNNSVSSSSNATATEILLRQHREDSLLSSSSPSLAQIVMVMASHRQQTESMAAMAAVAAVAANNTVDSRLLRLELIRAHLNRNNGPCY